MKYLLTLAFLLLAPLSLAKDFRNASWGMDSAAVKAGESAELLKADKATLAYKGKLGKDNMMIIYKFLPNDELYAGYYVYADKYPNAQRYWQRFQEVDKALRGTFGKPSQAETKWANRTYMGQSKQYGTALAQGHVLFMNFWEQGGEEISHGIYGGNGNITHIVSYASQELKAVAEKLDKAVPQQTLQGP